MLQRYLYAILTPLLLWIAWPPNNIALLLFIAFIPQLMLEENIFKAQLPRGGTKLFLYSWLSFGLFNLFTTWWLVNAHWSAVATTVLVNGALMAAAFSVFHFIRKKLGSQRGYISLPFLWICIEVLHKNWDLSFPWLNLGNGFAANPEWVQWYEVSGTFGGSLWILLVNILIFIVISKFRIHRKVKNLSMQLAVIIILFIGLPIGLSYWKYSNYEEKGVAANIVIVQPNIDTYTEKNMLSNEEQAVRFLRLANFHLDSSVSLLIGPEDLLPDGIYIDNFSKSAPYNMYSAVCESYPQLSILSGATLLQHYPNTPLSSTARPYTNTEGYYDVYNSAIFMNSSSEVEVYHKSKLVAGVEKMPFSNIIKPVLGQVIRDMGGSAGSLGYQSQRTVFTTPDNKFHIAPLICWESDFGEYVSEFVRNGAEILAIITNDDWWGDSPGYIQHLHYARLRAIENRRSIARSANTGISCFINQRGDLIDPQPYKKSVAIKGSIKANSELTYYSKAGDVLGRVALFISGFLVLFAFVKGYLKKVGSLAG